MRKATRRDILKGVTAATALVHATGSFSSAFDAEPEKKGRKLLILGGTLSMYVGEPPERHDVPTGGLIHIDAGTPLQSVNHGAEDLLVYAYGTPPEDEHAEILESAL